MENGLAGLSDGTMTTGDGTAPKPCGVCSIFKALTRAWVGLRWDGPDFFMIVFGVAGEKVRCQDSDGFSGETGAIIGFQPIKGGVGLGIEAEVTAVVDELVPAFRVLHRA